MHSSLPQVGAVAQPIHVKPPLKLPKPPIHTRIGVALFALMAGVFASVSVALPQIHIVQELLSGNVPWPLLGFACISAAAGILLLWVGWRLRVWILPYEFTFDPSQNICGYVYRGSWIDPVDLSALEALVSEPAFSQRRWHWAISARFSDGRATKPILNYPETFASEAAAFQRAFQVASEIADYLEVPLEFEEWSAQVLQLHLKRTPPSPE